MLRHRLGYQLALLAIVCTLGIFLFPVTSGPYPSVHGPASALRALRAWMLLLALLSLTFAGAAGRATPRSWLDLCFFPGLSDLVSRTPSSVLRC